MIRVRTGLIVGVLLVLSGGMGFVRPAQEGDIQLPPVKRERLANGLEVMVIEQHQLPIVYLNVRIPAGSVRDPKDKVGLAEFTAFMLAEGTETRSAEEIAEEIEFVGGELFGEADLDHADIGARVLTDDLETGLKILSDVLLHPTFPDEEMEIARSRMLGDVRFTRDDPVVLVGEHLRYMVFGSNHPLGYAGEEETINSITRDDLVGFYERYYRPNGAMFVAAGDVDSEEIIARAKELFGGWQEGSVAPLSLPVLAPPGGHAVRFVNKPGQTQVQIALGHRGLEASHPDYLPLQLANYSLGGGAFSSRLLQVIRAEQGKTYTVFSSFPSFSFPGYFRVTTFTRNEQLRPTLELTLREIEKFRDEGLTPDELLAVQDHTAGSYVLRLETLGGLMGTLLDAEFLGRGLDYVRSYRKTVRSFSLEDINDVVERYFHPAELQIALLGDVDALDSIQGDEILPNVGIADVGVVSWLDPISQPGTPYGEFKEARQLAEEPFEVDFNARMDEGARALLEKAIAVQGGLEALQGLADYYVKAEGVVHQEGLSLNAEVERWVVPPRKVRQVLAVSFGGQDIELIMVWDGEQGWIKQLSQVQEMPADLVKDLRDIVELDPLLSLLFIGDERFQFKYGGTAVVDGIAAEVLEVINAEGNVASFYYDPETYYLLKVSRDPDGAAQDSILSDYRTLNGYTLPFSLTAIQDGQTVIEFEVSEYQFNQGLSDELFQKPQ